MERTGRERAGARVCFARVSGLAVWLLVGGRTYGNGETGGHSVEVIGMFGHGRDFRHDRVARPVHAEDFGEFLEVLRAGLANAEDRIPQPAHTQRAEFLVEELHAQLRCEQGHVLDDGQPHAPLLVFRQLHDGWEQALRQQLDADDVVDLLELGDDVQSDVGEVVFEHLQEHGEENVGGVLFAEDGGQAGDLVAQRGAHVLRGVGDEFFDGGHDFAEEGGVVD